MSLATPDSTVVSLAELERRIIEPHDFVADTAAFVDVRLPRSEGKASYSFIGPGVSQNAGQSINLIEPHGFNVGAASMPHGCVNNPHLHFTAEVFICTRGRWRMNVGEHGDQHLDIGPGTVFSAPTWTFRGFENIGDDDGWLFVVLGGDETGGIIWAPSVLREAATTGLYLGADNSLRDARAGDPIDDVIEPLTASELDWVRRFDDDELGALAIPQPDLDWSESALLSHSLDGHRAALAPVIGAGMTEDREQAPQISTPHGFSVEWLRVGAGEHLGMHRHDGSQVLLLVDGDWEVALNRGAERIIDRPATGSVVSIPAGAWRDFSVDGDRDGLALVVNGGDGPTRLDWDDDIVTAANAAGWTRDAAGYLAPTGLFTPRT